MTRWTERSLPLAGAAVALVLTFAPHAAAQGEAPKVEVAGGYAVMHDNGSSSPSIGLRQNFFKGWFASVAGNLSGRFGVVGNVSANYRTRSRNGNPNPNVYLILAGPRIATRDNRTTVFAQALFGAARSRGGVLGVRPSETAFAFQPGAGVEVAAGSKWALQLGLNLSLVRAGGKSNKGTQGIAGIVYRK